MSADAILVYSPKKELEVLANLAGARKGLDWKPAIILSAAYLEKIGSERLQRYFGKRKVKISKKKLKGLSLSQVAILLYGLGLVEHEDFKQINQIRTCRNDVVHQKKALAYVGQEADKKFGKMIQDTLRIIGKLGIDEKE